MKSYLLFLLLLLSFSCVDEPERRDVRKEQYKETVKARLVEVEYDGCQYLVYKGYEAGGMVHKGNCTNH